MDSKEYKNKKYDKLTRDIVKMVNQIPSFGYGDAVDGVVKTSLTNHLLTLVNVSEQFDVDIEILTQSISDEIVGLSRNLVLTILGYQADLKNNE